MANWRANLETVHILAILRGFFGSGHEHSEALFMQKNSSKKTLSGGIETGR